MVRVVLVGHHAKRMVDVTGMLFDSGGVVPAEILTVFNGGGCSLLPWMDITLPRGAPGRDVRMYVEGCLRGDGQPLPGEDPVLFINDDAVRVGENLWKTALKIFEEETCDMVGMQCMRSVHGGAPFMRTHCFLAKPRCVLRLWMAVCDAGSERDADAQRFEKGTLRVGVGELGFKVGWMPGVDWVHDRNSIGGALDLVEAPDEVSF